MNSVSVSRYVLLVGAASAVLVGVIEYFAGISQVLWVPYLMALGAFLLFIGERAKLRRRGQPLRRIPLLIPVSLFLLSVPISVLVNLPPALQVLVGSKSLLMFWGVFLLVALGLASLDKHNSIFVLILPLALLQLPFVAYQHFFIASRRVGEGASWDAVVGTFGGDPNGGGGSGVLAFVVVAAITLAVSMRRRKLIGRWYFALLIASCLACLLLAEVKIVLLLLPIGLLISSITAIRKSPIRTLILVVSSICIGWGVLFYYNQSLYGYGSYSGNSAVGLVEHSLLYNFKGQLFNPLTGEMSRIGALELWWSDGFSADWMRGLFGYGPGSARSSSTIAVGEVAKSYPFGIDRSAASQLLWELGVVGLLAYANVFVCGAVASLRLVSKYSRRPNIQASLEASAAILLMGMIMIPYSRDVLEVPALSFIVMLTLGFVSHAGSKSEGRGSAVRQSI